MRTFCRRAVLRTSLRLAPVVIAACACTGCIGLAVDKPWNETFDNPSPRRANAIASFSNPPRTERWLCRSQSDAVRPPSTRENFRQVWGEPKEKRPTANGEEWIYREDGRWCGVWVSFIVPVPLMAPVCSTHDYVEFSGDAAVRAASRRRDIAFVGIVIYPTWVLPIPIPYATFPSATKVGPFMEYANKACQP